MKKYLFPLFAALFLSGIGVLAKLIGDAINPFSLTFYRVLLALGLMFFILLKTSGSKYLDLKRKEVGPFMILGALMAATFSMFITAVNYAPVANVILIDYTYPIIVYFLAHYILKERIKFVSVISLAVALSGVFMIFIHEFQVGAVLFGNILALLSGISYGILITYLKYEERVEESSLHAIFWPMVFACIFLSPLFMYAGPGTLTGDVILYVLLMGAVCTGFGYICFSESLKRMPAHIVSVVLLLLDPILTILLAFLVLGETISINIAIGGALIIMAALLMQKELHNVLS